MRKLEMVGLAGWVAMLMQTSTVKAQGQGDVLNESPLAPIPQEMSYEEYRDMNRRLTLGLALKAIPVPGMLHFYAGESKTGKRLLTTSLLGVASIMALAEDDLAPGSGGCGGRSDGERGAVRLFEGSGNRPYFRRRGRVHGVSHIPNSRRRLSVQRASGS